MVMTLVLSECYIRWWTSMDPKLIDEVFWAWQPGNAGCGKASTRYDIQVMYPHANFRCVFYLNSMERTSQTIF